MQTGISPFFFSLLASRQPPTGFGLIPYLIWTQYGSVFSKSRPDFSSNWVSQFRFTPVHPIFLNTRTISCSNDFHAWYLLTSSPYIALTARKHPLEAILTFPYRPWALSPVQVLNGTTIDGVLLGSFSFQPYCVFSSFKLTSFPECKLSPVLVDMSFILLPKIY